jgi:hypothetical protein
LQDPNALGANAKVKGGPTMPEPAGAQGEATLVVVRPSAWMGRMAPIEIHLDGVCRGLVENANFAVFSCASGTHEVVARQRPSYSSLPVTVTLPPGGRAELFCRYNMPTSRIARLARIPLIGLIAFAVVYSVIPGVKSALTPYEAYWGPVLIAVFGLTFAGLASEMIPQLRQSLSRESGTVIVLSEQSPTISDEAIRGRRLEQVARGNRV